MSTADMTPREFVWGPTINRPACTDCGACLDFCQNGVYEWVDGHVMVAHRASCIAGCSHCTTLCEAGALAFPTIDELRAARRKD